MRVAAHAPCRPSPPRRTAVVANRHGSAAVARLGDRCRAVSCRHGVAEGRSSRSAAARSRSRNPDKVYFPKTGYTKLDLVRYYLAVADGALAGVRGRPMALKRFVDGADEGAVLPEAGPGQPTRLDPDRDADVPVRANRRRDRRRRRGRPRLGRQPRLHRPQPAPGPRRRPRPSRRAARRPRPGPGRRPGRRSATWRWSTREALEAVGLVGWPKTSGSRGIHINVRIERRWTYPEVRRAALALARDVERRAPSIATSKWWKEERHGVFLDYNQNAKDRTVASAYSVRPLPDARVSFAAALGRGGRRRGRGLHARDGARAIYAERGDAGAGIDDAVGLARGAARAQRAARGRGPGRRAVAAQLREAGGRAAARPAVAQAHGRRASTSGPRRGRRSPARGRRGTRGRRRGRRSERRTADRVGRATRPTPTGRRKIERSRSSRSLVPRPRPRRTRASSAGRPAIPRPRSTSSRPTSCRRDARPPYVWYRRPGEPDPRPGGERPAAGAARPRLRPVGGLRVARPGRPAGARAEEEAASVGWPRRAPLPVRTRVERPRRPDRQRPRASAVLAIYAPCASLGAIEDRQTGFRLAESGNLRAL